jgi:TonB family protein
MRSGDFLMRVHRGILAVICTGVALASARLARPQDATSANLPERLGPGESMPRPAPKKKKAERRRELAAHITSPTPAPVAEQTPPGEEAATAATPVAKKARVKRQAISAAQSKAVSFPTATQMSLSAAQALAVTAPLPEYPYEAKHANITGSGVCVMIVDTASGKVTNAMMAQSTGNSILDKVTTETFRRWRFQPGSVSQVRVPITYE